MKFLRITGHLARVTLRSFRSSWALHLVAIGTISTAFIVFVSAMVLFVTVRNTLLGSKAGPHISVYLDSREGEPARKEIEEIRCKESFVARCEFRSAEAARDVFVKLNPDLGPAVKALRANPFPASVELEIHRTFKQIGPLKEFSGNLSKIRGVTLVDDGGDWLTRWVAFLRMADYLMLGVGLALGTALVFIVANTIRLFVYQRKDEVEILNLVGATDFFIRTPFVLEGLLQGMVGSALALLIVRTLLAYLQNSVGKELLGLFASGFFIPTIGLQFAIVGVGGWVGVVGSYLAVRRFLHA